MMKRYILPTVMIFILGYIVSMKSEVLKENRNYDKGIINDGVYIEMETGNGNLKHYVYPALEDLLESIEDIERENLIREILSKPTHLEFSIKETAPLNEQNLEEMYKEVFSMTEKLINLPMSELREKANDARKNFEELRSETGHKRVENIE